MHRDWWESDEWSRRRQENFFPTLIAFQTEHKLFAERYKKMFMKIVQESRKWNERNFQTLEKFRLTQLNENKAQGQREFGKLNAQIDAPNSIVSHP